MAYCSNTPHPPSIQGGVDAIVANSHRERDDNYRKIVIQLAPRWRVIICKDNIQMILQKRSVLFPNKGTWAGRKYCVTRKALIRDCSELGLLSDASAGAILEALPEILRAPTKRMLET